MLPADNKPLRLPATTPQQTAIFPFEQVKTETIPVGGCSYLIFMDPVYPIWKSITSSITGGYKTAFTPPSTGVLAVQPFPQSAGASIQISLSYEDWTAASATWGSPSMPAGVVAGVVPAQTGDNTNLWWFVPSGTVPAVQFVGTAANLTGGTWAATLQRTVDGTVENSKKFTVEVGVGSAATLLDFVGGTETQGGWYRLCSLMCVVKPTTVNDAVVTTINVGWLSGGTLSVPTATTLNSYYPVASLGAPEIGVAAPIYDKCRLNAGSFLFQNVTAVLNKEGSIRAGALKMAGRTVFFSPASVEAYWNDSIPSKRYTGRLENGLYTFMQPEMSLLSGTAFADSTSGQNKNNAIFNLEPLNTFYYISFVPASEAQTLQITYVCHHETVNDSMLYPTGVCQMPTENYRQAMLAALEVVPFVENPIHWAALGAAAKRLAGYAWQKMRPNLNPWGHKAVDWIIPKYEDLSIRDVPSNPYR